MVWEQGLLVRKMETRTDYEWTDIGHISAECVSQSTQDEWEDAQKYWVNTLAVDGSTNAPGKYAATGFARV